MYAFTFERPSTVADAAKLVARPNVKPLAGGQSLVASLKLRLANPEQLVDLGAIADLAGIAREGKGNYHFIRDGGDTASVFRKEMDELSHVVARAVKLRVVLSPGVQLVRVLGSNMLDSEQTRKVKDEEKRRSRKNRLPW